MGKHVSENVKFFCCCCCWKSLSTLSVTMITIESKCGFDVSRKCRERVCTFWWILMAPTDWCEIVYFYFLFLVFHFENRKLIKKILPTLVDQTAYKHNTYTMKRTFFSPMNIIGTWCRLDRSTPFYPWYYKFIYIFYIINLHDMSNYIWKCNFSHLIE